MRGFEAALEAAFEVDGILLICQKRSITVLLFSCGFVRLTKLFATFPVCPVTA